MSQQSNALAKKQTPSSDVYPQVLLSALLITSQAFDGTVHSFLRMVFQKELWTNCMGPTRPEL